MPAGRVRCNGDPAWTGRLPCRAARMAIAASLTPRCAPFSARQPHFDQAVHSGAIEICIDRLPLMPGLYQVDLWLGDMLRSLDAVESAVSFEVTEADVTGTGKLPPANCGPIFQTAAWSLTQTS